MSTAVPPIQWTSTGIVVPTEEAVLAGTSADINAAFGGALNMAPQTPQGQLAASEAAIVGDKNDDIAQYVNQVDPAYAAGRMQDAIGRIYFIDRLPATPTTVAAVVVGAADTPIPAGWPIAQDKSTGSLYMTQAAVSIPSGGSLAVTLANTQTGPLPVGANALSIYKAINGVDAVSNAAPGVLGSDVENRNDFELRRQNSVAKNGRGSVQSMYGNVLAVPGVLDAYAYENTTGAPITVGATSFTLAAHSVYIGQYGGDPAATAQAMWLQKSPGCDWNGSTVETIYDTENYSPPYPQYTVKQQLLAPTPVYMALTIQNNPQLPSNIVSLVQAAIVSAFAGGDGGPRARSGSNVAAGRYYAPVMAVAPPGVVVITAFDVGLAASPSQMVVLMGIDQTPTISAANIAVTVS